MEVGSTEVGRFVRLAGLDAVARNPGLAKDGVGLILVAFRRVCRFVPLVGEDLSFRCAPENQRVRAFAYCFLHSFVKIFVR